MFLPLMHLRLVLLLLVTTIAFASPLAPPDAEYFGQASIGGSGPENNIPAFDGAGDVYYHGSAADKAPSTSNYLDTSAVNLLGSSTLLIAQSEEDEIPPPEDQFRKFKNTRCGGEDSVCCMGDRTYFSSGVGTSWPCSMSKL